MVKMTVSKMPECNKYKGAGMYIMEQQQFNKESVSETSEMNKQE
jgi:hypothetical protein